MNNKSRSQLWIDFETGGIETYRSSPLSCAMLGVVDGVEVGWMYVQIRQAPFHITEEAMKINKLDLETPGLSFEEFRKVYFKFINQWFYGGTDWSRAGKGFYPGNIKANKDNMPLFCGHNTFFDRQVLQQCLGGLPDVSKYDGIYYHRIDTMVLANTLQDCGILAKGENLKLETVCKILEVESEPGEFHNALTDIKMTFKAYQKMKKIIMQKGEIKNEPSEILTSKDFFHPLEI